MLIETAKSVKIYFAFFILSKGDFLCHQYKSRLMYRVRSRQPRHCHATTCLGTSIDEYSVAKNIHLPKVRKHAKRKIHLHHWNADKQEYSCVETGKWEIVLWSHLYLQ